MFVFSSILSRWPLRLALLRSSASSERPAPGSHHPLLPSGSLLASLRHVVQLSEQCLLLRRDRQEAALQLHQLGSLSVAVSRSEIPSRGSLLVFAGTLERQHASPLLEQRRLGSHPPREEVESTALLRPSSEYGGHLDVGVGLVDAILGVQL